MKAVFGCVPPPFFFLLAHCVMLMCAPLSGTRSIRKTRDAVRQFTIVARGQEGSNFGFAW